MQNEMELQKYTPDRAREIADLFHDSVHAIAASHYKDEQIYAWAPTPVDYEAWKKHLDRMPPTLAVCDKKIAGFITLAPDGYIDRLYTNKDFQRKGVASMLLEHIEQQAQNKHIKELHTDASLIAKPFFEKQGFTSIKENQVCRDGILVENFSMKKTLAS